MAGHRPRRGNRPGQAQRGPPRDGGDGDRSGHRVRFDNHGRHDRNYSPRRSRSHSPARNDDGYTFRGASRRDERRREDNFSFNAPGPPAPRFPPAARRTSPSYKPRGHDNRFPANGRQGARGGRGRGGFKPQAAHSRDILHRTHRETTPEQLPGMNENGHIHFATVISSSEGESEDGEVARDLRQADDRESESRKRVKFDDTSHENQQTPKWSNPDPYTSLPPVATSSGPKTDFVQKIRLAKTKVSPQTSKSQGAVVENADFISFDDDDHNSAQMSNGRESGIAAAPPKNAPTAPASFDRRDKQHTRSTDAQPPSNLPPGVLMSTETKSQSHNGTGKGKKKRDHEQQIRELGDISEDWEADDHDPTPWCTWEGSNEIDQRWGFHHEIVDFATYVGPRRYEEAVRHDLIRRIQEGVRAAREPGARLVDIECFGSFASGLYLPTADMDLVAVSPNYRRYGQKTFCQTSSRIHQLAHHLEYIGIADPGTVRAITKAKVPIVKFTDRLTGIKVDISFENDSGLVALGTIQQWKLKYPAMPTIVMLIKQMLAMRDLNEVFNGGIGGYSIICLVVSMMQLVPELECDNVDKQHHYGDILLHFLDLYGRKLDICRWGIIMEPPRYFDKVLHPRPGQNSQRLTIMDPNRNDNDISGGTRHIYVILDCFKHAHEAIEKRLKDYSSGRNVEGSILGCVLGGNYRSFRDQREKLERVHLELEEGIHQLYEMPGPRPERAPRRPPKPHTRNPLPLPHQYAPPPMRYQEGGSIRAYGNHYGGPSAFNRS